MRTPNFQNMLKVLRHEAPDRPTLFEFFLNPPLYERLSEMKVHDKDDYMASCEMMIKAYTKAGYDYTTVKGSDFAFPQSTVRVERTRSLNDGAMIWDRETFEKYPWPDADKHDYSRLEKCASLLPEGMKLIVWGPGGVLENVIALVGYENLCYMIIDDPELAYDIFEAVGSRFIRYYELCAKYDTVGALISNDDWGFKNQPMLSPDDMRKYVFPWHKRIVEVIHAAGKPAILHSCGNLASVMDDIIDDIKYDGKHSYEDNIVPVEEAYERWGKRVAILGGLDMDFVCRSTPEDIIKRAKAMLERTAGRGSYALGTGNSVPEYLPQENYLAMISAVQD